MLSGRMTYDVTREHKQKGLNPAFEEASMFKQIMDMHKQLYKRLMDEEQAEEKQK